MKYSYKPIKRNRDEYGRVLSYKVITDSGITLEFNTLKEARKIALIIPKTNYSDNSAKKLLNYLNKKYK